LFRCLTLASYPYKLGVLSYASPKVRLERKRVYLSANTHIPAQFVDSLFPLEITESTPKLCGNLGFVSSSVVIWVLCVTVLSVTLRVLSFLSPFPHIRTATSSSCKNFERVRARAHTHTHTRHLRNLRARTHGH
jgi:hypothetical protein